MATKMKAPTIRKPTPAELQVSRKLVTTQPQFLAGLAAFAD